MPPEVCGPNADDSKREHLLTQSVDVARDGRVKSFIKRDKPLLVAIGAMILLMNIPMVGMILYPFKIFSTWIHELCHGLAAILVGTVCLFQHLLCISFIISVILTCILSLEISGGGIAKILIYSDTSGLAYTSTNGSSFERGFVASAGYTGTAVLGMILLLFRRTHRGPTFGTIGIGTIILLSCILYVRNLFALLYLPIFAFGIIICAWKLKAKHVGYLYSFLAATIAFNSVDNISELFGGQGYVNGQPSENDANAVAEQWGGTTFMWSAIWFIFAMVCCSIGLLFAFDGLTYKKEQRNPTVTLEDQTSDLVVNDIENGASIAAVTGVVIAKTQDAASENNKSDTSGMTCEKNRESEVGQAAATTTEKKKKFWSMKRSRK